MKRGQVSIEFLIAITMVLMVFILALLIISQQNQQKNYLEASDLALEQCNFFATAISSVSGGGNGTEKTIQLNLDANIINGYVKVESFICKIEADARNKTLKRGTVKIFRTGSRVDFNQITLTP